MILQVLATEFYIWLIVFALGAGVGATEIISRYVDDPWRTVLLGPGMVYVVLNGLISVAALYVGSAYLDSNQYWAEGFDLWDVVLLVIVFGLSGLAFFRTKVFTIRVGGEDIGVGPSFVLETLLRSLDRSLDRRRAVPRSNIIREVMEGVSFDNARVTLPSYCFALMQNVSATEQAQLSLYVSSIAEMDVPDLVKVDMLGLALLDMVGEDVLRTAIANTKSSLAASTDTLDRIEQRFAGLPFALGQSELPSLCQQMKVVPPESVDELEVNLIAISRRDVTERTKSLLMGFELVDMFGWEVVERALDAIAADNADT